MHDLTRLADKHCCTWIHKRLYLWAYVGSRDDACNGTWLVDKKILFIKTRLYVYVLGTKRHCTKNYILNYFLLRARIRRVSFEFRTDVIAIAHHKFVKLRSLITTCDKNLVHVLIPATTVTNFGFLCSWASQIKWFIYLVHLAAEFILVSMISVATSNLMLLIKHIPQLRPSIRWGGTNVGAGYEDSGGSAYTRLPCSELNLVIANWRAKGQ